MAQMICAKRWIRNREYFKRSLETDYRVPEI